MGAGTFVALTATVITAVATSVSAYVAWQLWRGRLTVDWHYAWSLSATGERTLEVKLTVHNETSSIVDIRFAEVIGAGVVNVRRPNQDKHESWGASQVPIFTEVAPHKNASATIYVTLDWRALDSSRRSLFSSKRNAMLRIQTTLASRSSRRRTRKITSHIPIPKEMIKEMTNAKAA